MAKEKLSKASSSIKFEEEYGKLNKAQKDAVDTIEGPVMVVAGPGTGKTQILALRIGNILLKTDTQADSILCLTFTNSAVRAMRERLRRYIGVEAGKVRISTFHSFGLDMLDRYYEVLGLERKPELMDEKAGIALADEILEGNQWEYIRPRGDTSRYFRDLKSLVSFLKRERITSEELKREIAGEIQGIEEDPDSISSRGGSKGSLKKEAEKKIEGLRRTLEAVKFYDLYESAKKEKNFFDYDDILESLVAIVEESAEAKSQIRENFLYVLIDEHQDSSGVQNEFLESVWSEVEKPNIFVVGDDRQLIYGFGGASLEYFENFKNTFGKAKLITLIENYRSTQKILDSAHLILESSIATGKLKSNREKGESIRLVEAYYPRDEIISAGLEIKERISEGGDPNDMAILVPKNRQVEGAVNILRDMGIPVAGGESTNFFDVPEAASFLRILKIVAHPGEGSSLALSFFDSLSGISPIKAHEFLRKNDMRNFSLISATPEKNSLFDSANGISEVNSWLNKLKSWLAQSGEPLYVLIQRIGTEFLLDSAKSHEELVRRIEVLRTTLHLLLLLLEKPKGEGYEDVTLSSFLSFMDRLRDYGEKIPLAIFSPSVGVKVLTLHASKGLEFDYVWIAHMDERSFTGTKKGGFTLPAALKERVEKKDELVSRRELYVAITRAKRFCAVSYALKSYDGAPQELAHIVADLSGNMAVQKADETEKNILSSDPKAYVSLVPEKKEILSLPELVKLVANDYEDRKVSVSLLNNFFECPWKWYFRNLLLLPEPKSESLEFGNIVHSSIDAVLKLPRIPSREDIENMIWKEVRGSHFGDERKQNELFRLAYGVVSKWVLGRLSKITRSRESEQSVQVADERFPNLTIYGKIDLIENLDREELRVTDFKTGAPRKKSDIEKRDEEGRMSGYLRQLAMYSYLIKQSPKWKAEVRESRLEFLEAKKESDTFYDTVINPAEISLMVKDIEDYSELVKNGAWINRPCNYNSYGKNTECEYCKMSNIYKA